MISPMSPPPLAPVPAFPDCDRRLQGITQALTLLLSHPDVAQALPSALEILGETWQIDRLGLEPWYPEWFDGEGDLDPESLWLWQRHSETAGGRSPLNPALLPQIPEPWRRTLATGSPCLQALALGENPWLQQQGLEQLLLWPIDWIHPSQWRGVLSVAVAANPRGGTAAVGTTAVAGAAAIGTATGTAVAGSAAVAGPAAVGTATIGTTADTTTVGTATVGTATVGTATIGTTTDTAATDTAATDTAATDTAATDTARPRTAQALWTEAEVALWGQVAQALGGSVGRYQESQRLVQQVDRRTAELWQAIEELEAKAVDYEEAEAQLQANYTLLHSVINGTSDLIFVKDCQGRYVLVNDAALDFWQLPRKAVLGHDETLIFPPEEAQNLLAIDETILHQGLSKTLEECVTLRGQTYTFLTTKTPYHDQRGQVIGLVGITRDITRRKQAENSLLQKTEELQAALGEVQKTQSHLIHSEKMSSL
ncbi:PAS domain-containing protein, partial [Prochlorothrix hollandica]|uniref:PAS domain-containing protein n=1 Tax=Prochlorothrix hollandica TaxID=1223 RepID=UPI00334055E6